MWKNEQGQVLESGEPLNRLAVETPRNTADLIKRRRSVRHYRPQALPESVIKDILVVVNHAPTGTNSRGVGITVVNSMQRMQELSDLTMRFFRLLSRIILNPLTIPCIFLCTGRKGLRRLQGYKAHIDRYFRGENNLTHDAPVLFVFHADRRSSCPSEDAVIWAANAQLYAESLGIGTCYNGFLVRAAAMHRPLRRFLGIPSHHTVYETFTAGYPAVRYQRTACRDSAYHHIIT